MHERCPWCAVGEVSRVDRQWVATLTPYKTRRGSPVRGIGRHYRICLDAIAELRVDRRLSALPLLA